MTCDNFLLYSPGELLYTGAPYNLSSGAIEGFYYADAPWNIGSDPNSLIWLFQDSGYLANGGTVVANPLYPLENGSATPPSPNTIGSLNDLEVLGTPMPSESSQLDFRAGHFSQISHNWPGDTYTKISDAANQVCLADQFLSDDLANVSGEFMDCRNSEYYSAVPGWNAYTGDGDTFVTVNQYLHQYVWSAGIKSVIAMPTYMGGMGDTFLIDADSTFKPAWTGQGDEGLKLMRFSTAEASTYTGSAFSYAPVSTGSTAPTAGNVLIVKLGAPSQQVGVGHPMLDTSVSYPSTTGTIMTPGYGASVLKDTASPGWTPSVSGVVFATNQASDPRLLNSGQATLTQFTLQPLSGPLAPGDLMGLCQVGAVNTGGGLSGCQLNYEQAQVNAVLSDYDPSTQTEIINAYVRFPHPVGAGVNGGGLVGSYISFDDYYNSSGYNNNSMGPTQIPQMYVQNVFSNSSDTLTFGIMRAGAVVSYPELYTVASFGYHLWRGGTVYDVRNDPTNPAVTDPSYPCTGQMLSSADGCYFVIEDNNPAFPTPATGGAWSGTVAQTNYQAANWLGMYSSESMINPYASYTALDVATPAGTGAGYSGAVGLRVGGIGNGFTPANYNPILQEEANLSPTGLYVGPIMLQGYGFFGEGWYMSGTPFGVGQTNPDMMEIAKWTQCFATSSLPIGNCTVVSSTGDYYQNYFNVLEVDESDAIANSQNQRAFRNGTYQFNNYGTQFLLNGSPHKTAAVKTSTIQSGSEENTDIAGYLPFSSTTTASQVFIVPSYNVHPECVLQPQFPTASVGAPWTTYSTSVATVALIAGTISASGTGTLTLSGFGNATNATATATITAGVIGPLTIGTGQGGYNATAGSTTATVTCSGGATCSAPPPTTNIVTTTAGASLVINFASPATGEVSYICVGRG